MKAHQRFRNSSSPDTFWEVNKATDKFEFQVIEDGWIKIPAESYSLGFEPVKKTGRLLIGLNQLFLRISGKNVLVDTGLGDKFDYTAYGLLDYARPRRLLVGLADAGISTADVNIVILTHLHFDHSGGGTRRLDGLSLAPTFTNALYYVQKSELDYARSPEPSGADDYILADFEPLIDSGQLKVIEGDHEIIPNLKIHLAPGHSSGHQVVTARSKTNTVFFPGDLFAVREHANLNLVTSFDYDQGLLLRERKKWISAAHCGRWICVFCHAVCDAVGFI